MLKGNISIKDWENTTETNYLNSKDGGKTHFCDRMEIFRKQLIEYADTSGLIIDYENKCIIYSFWKAPVPFDDKEQSEFELKLKYLFIKSIKSINTISEIKEKHISLEEELERSEQTIIDVKAAIINLDYCLNKYLKENKK